MMEKFKNQKSKIKDILLKGGVFFVAILSLALYTLYFILYTPSVHAQTACLSTDSDLAWATGLVTAPNITDASKFTTTSGACIFSPKAAFVPFKIPTYDDLKSLYFTQSKSTRKSVHTGDANQGHITSFIQSADTDRLIHVTGSLTIAGNGFLNGTPAIPIIIFVQNELNINNNIDFADNSSSGGLVFVVKGNVNIDKEVTQVNAVIISEGKIYTADAGCATSSVNVEGAANALIINGSLISLNPEEEIKFCRTLNDNSKPAEKINHQVKYLVILRNIFSDTLQRWSEVVPDTPIPAGREASQAQCTLPACVAGTSCNEILSCASACSYGRTRCASGSRVLCCSSPSP